MATANLVRIALHFGGLGEEGVMTFWYQGQGAVNADQAATALNSVDTALTSAETPSGYTWLKSILSASQVWDQLSLYYYPVKGPATVLAHKTIAQVGTLSAPNMPLQAAAVVSLLTARAGASYRGRIYLAPATVNLATDRQMIQAAINGYVAGVGQVAGDIKDALPGPLGWSNPPPFVVYSRKLDVATPVTTIKMDSRMDVQRRRAMSQQPLRTQTVAFPQ